MASVITGIVLFEYKVRIDRFRDWIDSVDWKEHMADAHGYRNFDREATGRLIEAKRDGWHCPEWQLEKNIAPFVTLIEGMKPLAKKDGGTE